MLAGIVLVLWNSFGLAVALRLQFGNVSQLDPASAAYFENQPLAFVLLADLGPLCGVIGALMLLTQHRSAVLFFTAQFIILALANIYEVLMGTSLLLTGGAAIVRTLFAFALFAAQVFYARWLTARGILH